MTLVKTSDWLSLLDTWFYDRPTEAKPPIKYKITEGGAEIFIALAGFKKEDVSVEADGEVIFIKGDNTQNKDIVEDFRLKFEQSFACKKLDPENAVVALNDGLLRVFVPKKEEKKRKLLSVF